MEDMNNCGYFVNRNAEFTDLGRGNVLLAQNELLSYQIEILNAQLKATQLSAQVPVMNCEFGMGMPQGEVYVYDQVGMHLEENAQMDYMGNIPWDSHYPQSNTYNPQFISHPDLSYINDHHHYLDPSQPIYQQNQQSHFPNQDQLQNFDQPFYSPYENFYQPPDPYHQYHSHQDPQPSNNHHTNPSNLENILITFMEETQSLFKNQDASIKNLENQIGQLSKQLTEKSLGVFPSEQIVGTEEETHAEGRSVEENKQKIQEEIPHTDLKTEIELQPTEIVDERKVSFNISETFKYPLKTLQCMNIMVLDSVVSASVKNESDSILKDLMSKTHPLSEIERKSHKKFEEVGSLGCTKPYKLHVELDDPP